MLSQKYVICFPMNVVDAYALSQAVTEVLHYLAFVPNISNSTFLARHQNIRAFLSINTTSEIALVSNLNRFNMYSVKELLAYLYDKIESN
jgi:hypothetical protein